MSIYTSVEKEQLESFLESYSIGSLVSFKGIEAGVENTNYFVTTSVGEYVLTLVESVNSAKAIEIVGFQAQLAAAHLKVAAPLQNSAGQLVSELNGKPAVIATRLAGEPVVESTIAQSGVMGGELAKFHRVSLENNAAAPSSLLDWCSGVFGEIESFINPEDAALIKDFLLQFSTMPWSSFESGAVHADLFPDNALFVGDKLQGVIDFYHTMNAPFVYDLAVMLNAWCYSEEVGCFYPVKEMTMLKEYEVIRALSDLEREWLKPMRKLAALRFWLSRLKAHYLSRPGAVVSTRDPVGKRQLLLHLDAV
jgi:homoserine kinase type II